MKSEIKELREYLHYVKTKQYTNPCLARNHSILKGRGWGWECWPNPFS